jgi:hypothetical protein
MSHWSNTNKKTKLNYFNWKLSKKSKLNSDKILKMWKKSRLNCEMIWKIWNFFCIFQIFSLFNLLFFHNFNIFSLFNLLFFHIFHIISQFSRHVQEKQVTLHFKRCSLKKYGNMKCFITSCTRKASNVAFQTLRFQKVRENEMFYYVMH